MLVGGYSHCIKISQYGLEFSLYLLSLLSSSCKSSLHVYYSFISPQCPHFFLPLKCRQKGCLDKSMQNKSYEAQVISDTRETRPVSYGGDWRQLWKWLNEDHAPILPSSRFESKGEAGSLSTLFAPVHQGKFVE